MNNNPDSPAPLLEMRQISKYYPGVKALNDVSLKLRRAEVVALVGENGAGKSTLIKILGGAVPADSGEILINGNRVQFDSPARAWHYGISIIYQEFNLIPALTVRENIFLGKEKRKSGFVDSGYERNMAAKLFAKIGIEFNLEARCADLAIAQQQMVEIAKALSLDAQIIVMDEPSATLTAKEVKKLFSVIKDLKKQGISIIYISHRLEEIFKIADRVVVLRDGYYVGESEPQKLCREELIKMMVGRPLESEFPEHPANVGKERLRVENLTKKPAIHDVNFSVHEGEILGFAGLVGAGRTETVRLIFGADAPDSGKIFVNGIEAKIRSPRHAIKHRICLLTEDRKTQGLILNHSGRENFGLPNLAHFSGGPFIDQRKERNAFSRYVDELAIKIADYETPVSNLSGGNQQKIVLAKWLQANADIIIFDEPTRGIDVGAKYEIYLLINKLAEAGKSILFVSSELPELIGMCGRIIVMHQGRIAGEIKDPSTANQEDIIKMGIAKN